MMMGFPTVLIKDRVASSARAIYSCLAQHHDEAAEANSCGGAAVRSDLSGVYLKLSFKWIKQSWWQAVEY